MGVYLLDLLDSIYSQNFDVTLFEVIVNDNSSEDSTDNLVKKFHSYQNFKFSQNIKNIGAENNFLKTVEISCYEYVWIVGADDIISPGSLKILFETINKESSEILIFDRRVFFDDLNKASQESPFYTHTEKIFKINSNESLKAYLENTKNYLGLFSYLSNFVFKRQLWYRVGLTDFDFGYHYIHSVILFKNLISLDSSIHYIPHLIVYTRLGNCSFSIDGYPKRIELDVYGFLHISSLLPQSVEGEFLNIIWKYNKIRRFIKYFLLESNKSSRNKMISTLKRFKYPSYAYLFIFSFYIITGWLKS